MWEPGNKDKPIQADSIVLRELWNSPANTWTINAGTSVKNLGITVGYNPDILNKAFEVHGGIFNSWQDTIDLKFSPKIGIGVTLKVKF